MSFPFSPCLMSTEIDQLTERDLQSVRDLIEEVRAQERAAQLATATVIWLNAFCIFKKARKRHGVPRIDGALHFYGMMVADLKASGKALLFCAEKGLFEPRQANIDTRNLEACVRELSCDDTILEMGLLQADLSDVEAAFAQA